MLPDAVRGMDARLRDVETAFGKVDQRHPPSNAPASPARPASETATAPISSTRLVPYGSRLSRALFPRHAA